MPQSMAPDHLSSVPERQVQIWRIDDIRIGARHRRDLGDIASLADSILDIGLLHPILVAPDGTLIAGQRRLEACRMLGWGMIPVTILENADA